MIIKTKFEQGEIVKEIHTNFQGKVIAVESKMTGIKEIDEASQSFLVEKKEEHGIPTRRWIGIERLRRAE